jgi:hypothetical protein
MTARGRPETGPPLSSADTAGYNARFGELTPADVRVGPNIQELE